MKLKPLYISAPSRSGSSLLVKILNCTTNMAIVNEPIGSVDIGNKDTIEDIFHSIEQNLKYGFMIQRVEGNGIEVTDTFPPSKMKWGVLNRSPNKMEVVGIKKSFPAFSNKDFFESFVQEWPAFVKWMNRKMQGSVVAIVRDPIFTILSWKTTFEALKESTENQSNAWNIIANRILSSQKLGVRIVRYEDLVQNPMSVIDIVTNHIGIKAEFKETLPSVKLLTIEDYLNIKGISMDSAESDFGIIKKICGKTAKSFGYFST